ncbi:MAG: methyltransferase domain-containing protein [Longimicrobiales bacterium]
MDVHRLLGPVLKRLRRKRMRMFAQRFGITARTRVLDVGGTTLNWSLIDPRPDVTLLNLDATLVGGDRAGFSVLAADGCALPFADAAFEIVFSNSLIEHLPPERQRTLASEIQRVGRSYFVQTPNFWFPVEPHFWAPFFHWLPLRVRRRSVRWITPWGWLAKPTRTQAVEAVEEMRLLTATELRACFPDSELIIERAAGLPKSLIAVKRQSQPG